ncbi:hypothetical protein [Bradyrhizobium sp. 187]|uniref:hypothetical protein n=1 Tax=Bradyrhizobium sp. 187 TaxID=2782655 RepID=UPI00200021E9|nr:hypothetical protein [Bradyrhizobium sp. 187]UPJ77191.1 hypothetical protein IVB19_39540 [Bradyrhizobium sp. 187]
MIFDIPLDLDEQSSADKKGFGRMTIKIFDANLHAPTTLHDTRYAFPLEEDVQPGATTLNQSRMVC